MLGIKLVAVIAASAVALLGVSLIFASNNDLPGRLAGIDQARLAEDGPTPTATVAEVESESSKAQAIADYFSTHRFGSGKSLTVTADAILQLRGQDMGWGEIFKALQNAATSGQSVEAILALRQSGMGWGEIEKSLGAKIKGKHPNLGSVMSAANQSDKAKSKNSLSSKSR